MCSKTPIKDESRRDSIMTSLPFQCRGNRPADVVVCSDVTLRHVTSLNDIGSTRENDRNSVKLCTSSLVGDIAVDTPPGVTHIDI